ncbi:MAG: GNAT family N-acetyltransferase [Candidatus Binatia bacterium]
MLIREEKESGWPGVFNVNLATFDTPAEAHVVNSLREQCRPLLSLVAEEDGRVIGHILFSPVQLSGHPNLHLMGLAPMAIVPEYQRTGIGSALVKSGLDKCQTLRVGAVVVLGHSAYYPRFGFVPSVRYGIRCEYRAPEEAFMVLKLQAGYLAGKSGIIQYHDAFKNL